MIDQELMQEFIIEAREHIEMIEPDLVFLEKDTLNSDLINNIFAAFHSIKGSSGYIGLTSIYELSHVIESVIDRIRKNKLQVTAVVYDKIFTGLDILKNIVNDLDSDGKSDRDTASFVKEVNILLGDKTPSSNKTVLSEKIPELNTNSQLEQEQSPEIEDDELSSKLQSVKESNGSSQEETQVQASERVPSEETAPEINEDSFNEFLNLASGPFEDILRNVKLFPETGPSMDNIKGLQKQFNNILMIAEYQGLDDIWKNLLSYESRINEWVGQESIDLNSVQSWLEDLKRLFIEKEFNTSEIIDSVASEDESAVVDEGQNISASLTENECKVVFDDYDENLSVIFLETLSKNLEVLNKHLNSLNQENSRIVFISELDKVQQASNYMDVEWIHDIVLQLKTILNKNSSSESEINKQDFDIIKTSLNKIEQLFKENQKSTSEKVLDIPEKDHEINQPNPIDHEKEDGEMANIFVENYCSQLDKLVDIYSSILKNKSEEETLSTLGDTILLMKNAANYMDYEELKGYLSDLSNMLESVVNFKELDEHRFIREVVFIVKNSAKYLSENFKIDPKTFSRFDKLIVPELEEPLPEKESATPDVFNIDQIFESMTSQEEPANSDAKITTENSADEKEEIETESVKPQPGLPKQDRENIKGEPETKKEQKQKTLRIDVNKVEELMTLVGELVVNRSTVTQLMHEIQSLYSFYKASSANDSIFETRLKEFSGKVDLASTYLARISNQMQESVMRVRMLPVKNLFQRFPRMVREISKEADKEVKLVLSGEDTELDKSVMEELTDPLVHIIRNAIDHGIEKSDIRKKNLKPAESVLKISAYHKNNHIHISVEDDGRGLDKEKIVKTAIERGLVKPEQAPYLKETEIFALVFQPGFSTADSVSSLSGRGVGLDVVKRNITNLNGLISLESHQGTGTKITIEIPLTLAIIQALLVKIGNETFCIPLSSVVEVIKIDEENIKSIEGHTVTTYRDNVISILDLNTIFHFKSNLSMSKRFVVVVTSGEDEIGIMVDQLVGQQEIVIKPLDEEMVETEGINGAAILGGGDIALIIDISTLIQTVLEREKKIRIQMEVLKKTMAE